MNKHIIFAFLFSSLSVLSAQDCEDDATGAYSGFGGCETVINVFGQGCDVDFAGANVGEECPLSCYDCSDEDEGGINGCDLPDMSLSILSDGSVLYNSSADIGGFQFDVDGVTVTGVSGGDAEANGFNLSNSATTALGFSLTGTTIPAGCGTLVVVESADVPTGLSAIVISDPLGIALDFNYVAPPITDGCSLPDMNVFILTDGSVLYNTSAEIGGFQFDVDGVTVTGVSGGDAEANAFNVSNSEIMVLGFSLTGTTIPAGCGTLLVVESDGEPTGLSNIIISDPDAVPLDFSYYDGSGGSEDIAGCMDMNACNYNADATSDDGSCTYAEANYDCDGNCTAGTDCNGDCGGSAEIDECGVCDGDGIADGACDCAGNVDLGCGCGEAGPSGCDSTCGSTLEFDACGICGGDGSNDLGCGCFEPGPSGCDNACGSTLENDACGVCGGDDSSCEDCAGVPNGDAVIDDC